MKPILFSTPMIQAIQDGRKSMTRRVRGLDKINLNPDQWNLQSFEKDPELTAYDKNGNAYPKVKRGLIATFENNEYGEVYRDIKCPWEVEMVLWVRETWTDLRGMGFGNDPLTDKPWNFSYRADIKPGSESDRARLDYGVKWHPSIFMPRAAARIFLKVTNVRVERLQDITLGGCYAEGCPEKYETQPLAWFYEVWHNTIKAKDFTLYGRPANPWVFVTEFEKVKYET
ncbi:MAG: hypothetical protein WC365_00640 [Candidatus Babeliales bacterium]|jgi:hypothetical protein